MTGPAGVTAADSEKRPPAAGYRAALRVREFRLLAGAALISLLGDTAAFLATTVLVYQRTGSPMLAALVFAAAFVPHLLGGTLLAGLLDRLPPRRMLITADLLGAALVAIVAVPGIPVVAVFGVLVILGIVAPLRSGQAGALVADMLPGDAYIAGRSLLRISAQMAQVLGAAAGGALIAPLGPHGALLADAVTFLASATLIRIGVRYRSARFKSTQSRARGVVADSLRGAAKVWRHARLRRLVLLGWAVPFIAVAPEALAAPAVHQAGRSAATTGWWLTAIPAGMVVGDLIAVLALSAALRQRLLWPLAAAGPALMVAFFLQPPFPAQLALLVGVGAASAYGLSLDRAVLDAAPPEVLSRTLVLSSTGLMVGQGLGFTAAGATAELLTSTATIGAAGIVGVAAVLILGARMNRR